VKTFYNVIEYLTGALFNIIFIVLAVIAISFVGTRAYAYGIDMFRKDLNVPFEEFTIEIPEGDVPGRADAMAIGRILEEAGLTKNAMIFYVESRLNGTHNKFRPGIYEFTTHMSNGDIMDIIQSARFAPASYTRITIREGLNLRQIGELCQSMGLFTVEEWLEACAEYDRMFFFLEPVRWRPNFLEGYLFPNTYHLPENPTPRDLIDMMLQEFQRVFDYEMEERAEELGLTIDQVIIKASIIEKEIRVPAERAICSAIIYNRLRQGRRLEMCSTVLYALDTPRDRLTFADLEVDSLYNTYRNPGLPVGPICSPGRAAIVAALHPADTNYIFMVLKDEQTGAHFFSNNYDEHLEAQRQYNQPFAPGRGGI